MSRTLLALTIYFRYRAEPAEGAVGSLVSYAGDAVKDARILGLALRLGHSITGGTAGILPHCRLEPKKTTLVLHLPKAHADLDGEILRKRLRRLAVAMGREYRVEMD